MRSRFASGEPTSRDLSRLLLARASSRLAIEHLNEVYIAKTLAAFRAEIGATVRSVSPLLLAVLEHEGVRIDDVAWRLRPARGWPYRPRLPANKVVFKAAEEDLVWPVIAEKRAGRPYDIPTGDWHSALIGTRSSATIAVHVVDHSIEMASRLNGASYTTLFGMAQIELPGMTLDRMPFARSVRLLEEALPLPAIRERGWIVRAAEDALVGDKVEIQSWVGDAALQTAVDALRPRPRSKSLD